MAEPLPRRAPRLALAGVVVIVVALISEVTSALAGGSVAHDPASHGGHLVAFVGMVLVLIGVLQDGISRGRPSAAGSTAVRSKEVSDALR